MTHRKASTPSDYTELDMSGWYDVQSDIGPGDQIVILPDGLHRRVDRLVYAEVTAVSSNHLIGIDVKTEGANWIYGGEYYPIPAGFHEGWKDIKWDIAVKNTPPTGKLVTLVRNDGKDWLAQGPYTIDLQMENEDCFFGYTVDNSSRKRVWYKDEWKAT